jgi:hypothetical protein
MENVTNAFLTTSPFLVQLEQNKPDVNYTSLKLIDSPFLETTPRGLDQGKDATKPEDEADDYYEEQEDDKEQAHEVDDGEWPRSGFELHCSSVSCCRRNVVLSISQSECSSLLFA